MKINKLFLTAAAMSIVGVGLFLPAQAQDDSKAKSEASDNKQSSQSSDSHQANKASSQAHPRKVSEQDLRDKKVTKVNKASSFIGMTVKNLQNENLGKVEDLAFNPDSGKIAYAVVSVGGFLGMNEKYIAVPLNALTPAPGEDKLLLDADKQRLQNAPGFAKNKWPDLDAPAWGAAAGFARGASTNGDTNAVGHAGRSGQEQGSATGGSDENHFSGKISAVDTGKREMKVKADTGTEKTFQLDQNAQIKAGNDKDAKVDDLQVGSRVDVEFAKENGKDVAKSVHADQSASGASSEKK